MQQVMLEQVALSVARQLEDQIDSELHKLENLQDDDIEGLRQRRIVEMRKQQEKAREWLDKGHGEYHELLDEKEFFKEVKGEERMIVHFYRNSSMPCQVRGPWCAREKLVWRPAGCACPSCYAPNMQTFLLQVMDKHMAILCKQHLETKFAKVGARIALHAPAMRGAGEGATQCSACIVRAGMGADLELCEVPGVADSAGAGSKHLRCSAAVPAWLMAPPALADPQARASPPPPFCPTSRTTPSRSATPCTQIDAEKSPYLTEKLKIWMLPTLALIRGEKVVDYMVGFDDVGGTMDFPTEVLAEVIAAKRVLYPNDSARYRAGAGAGGGHQRQQRSVRSGFSYQRGSDDEDSDFD